MSLYRIAYEWPNGLRGRVTFAAANGRAAQRWAGSYAKVIKAYLLSVVEIRKLEIQLELM